MVPFLILPYYCTIGGWVLKYFIAFVTGHGIEAANDSYFSSFISDIREPIVLMAVFLLFCVVIVYGGVSNGIERSSKIMMPILLILVIGIAIYSLTIRSTDEAGKVITGLDGLKIYLIPDLKGVGLKDIFTITMDALSQLFFSLSVAMGILIAYGSYMPDEANLSKSINQIEFFDTFVAFLAGVMIVPAVFVFMGKDGMATGPSLMFVSLPKVFAAMGSVGDLVGAVFFAMVLFAAITSAVSILEAVVSSYIDGFHMTRRGATVLEGVLAIAIGVVVCLGYNVFYFEKTLPNGATAQILDIFDYTSNNILMPIVAIATCILVGWVIKPKAIIDEVTKNGEPFLRKGLYTVMVKFIAPALLIILFLFSTGLFS